ncbi:MAG: MBL fold metallo-hydrolase [bacterium]|nr:MBL fold metallo-hydrolase [bacterium]
MLPKKFRKTIIVYVIFIMALGLLIFLFNRTESNQELEITFFDVGQGDSIFIQTPSHQQILIDGGPDTSVVSKIGERLEFYDHHLDLVVLTHPHADHIMGLIEVLKRYEVDYVMYNDLDVDYDYYQEWEKIILENGITVLNPVEHSQIDFGEVGFKVIYPFENLESDLEDINDSSIVLKMEYQDFSTLFTGDATVEVEEEIIQHGDNIQSNILKVGHHGSKYSSSFDWLEKVNAEYAIIQVGEYNKFNHPHKITIYKLTGLGMEILRNDEMGDITINYKNGNIIID